MLARGLLVLVIDSVSTCIRDILRNLQHGLSPRLQQEKVYISFLDYFPAVLATRPYGSWAS
jgi:hypothetical protein